VFGSSQLVALQGTITYPTKREVGKIIDSKVPAGMPFVNSQEGIFNFLFQKFLSHQQHNKKLDATKFSRELSIP